MYRRLRTPVLVLLALLLGSGSTYVASGLFTDQADVTDNEFSIGTVEISTNPATALLTMSAMVPGDKVTAPITVSNDGSAEYRYAVTSTTDENVLSADMRLTVKSGVSDCSNTGFGSTGSVVRATGPLGNTTGINIIGDPAQGADAGDRVLAASATEVLCFQAEYDPAATDQSVASTTATLAFIAEQTSSNP